MASSDSAASSPDSWSSPSPSHDVPKNSEETVIELTKDLVFLVNSRSYDHPLLQRLMSPGFRGIIEGTCSTGPERHLIMHKDLCDIFPNYTLEVTDASADVDEQRGRAKVWITARTTHLHGEVERSSIHVFAWQRRGGVWTCHQQKGLRGIKMFE